MLSPNSGAITSQVTSDYRVNNYLMAWAHTLLNTNLFPVEPKPDWFDAVSTELSTTKQTTRQWLHEDFPKIAAKLPQVLIEYANIFDSAVKELLPLVAFTNPQGDDRKTVADVLKKLYTAADARRTQAIDWQTKVTAFAALVKKSSADMAGKAKKVKETISGADKELLALQTRIAELQRRLGITTTEAKNSMTGAATAGATISMTMLAFTVGAASFPIVGLAGAIIGIGLKAADEAAKSKEVLALIREIGELQVKLSAQQFQIAALETIAASFENLSDICSEALTCMDGTVHHWDDIANNVAAVRELVDQPQVDLSHLNAFKELQTHAKNWQTVKERAQKIQNSVMTVEKTILIGQSAA